MSESTVQDLDLEYLRLQARWIRDTLDPLVAREGPDALHSDDVLSLDETLRALHASRPNIEVIRHSRIHCAILAIAGIATRWPTKLIDRCDEIVNAWQAQLGPLKALKAPLYSPGGRLHGICKPADTSPERLLVEWLKAPGVKLSPTVARKPGCLGFTPGDWWISPLFAHLAGIIDGIIGDGGIVSDSNGVYAIILAGSDETDSPNPHVFQFRAHAHDPGRYRLTAATPDSRTPVRVLRSHTLHSPWRPRAGLRYDGLHVVTGWSIGTAQSSREVVYHISLRRLSTEISMEHVLCRPWSDEVDDYEEFKRLRGVHRNIPDITVGPAPALDSALDF